MIVVTFTSWRKRINNCECVIKQLLGNTMRPDIIYLNLSTEEFPLKENELPLELLQIVQDNCSVVKINWVEGANTRTMKKVFPMLHLVNDDDIIIYIDDDFIFPNDFIESRVNDLLTYNCAITGRMRLEDKFGIDGLQRPGGNCAIYKKWFNGYNDFLTDEIIGRYNDDQVYLALLLANGTMFRSASKYINYVDLVQNVDDNGISANVLSTEDYNYNDTIKLIKNRFKELYNKTMHSCALEIVKQYNND